MVLALATVGALLSFAMARTAIKYGYYFYLFLYADTDEPMRESD